MILVTGATGEYGKNAIHLLLKKGVKPSEIAALSRSEEKAKALKDLGIDVRIADYNNYDTLVEAFNGIQKLLFVSSGTVENRTIQHENVVKAAKESKVNHIVYTSFIRNTKLEDSAIAFLQESHLRTEEFLKNSGITYTILQNALYLDLIDMFLGEDLLNTGLIFQPAELGQSSPVLRKELAEAAVNILTSQGHENKIYPLVNEESLSFQDIADSISKISKKDITYQSPSQEQFEKVLGKNGVPQEFIGMLSAFSVAQAKGELDIQDHTLQELLGRKPTSIKEYLSTIYG
jgi:NAD(P)H dehydrogenase (quinone)